MIQSEKGNVIIFSLPSFLRMKRLQKIDQHALGAFKPLVEQSAPRYVGEGFINNNSTTFQVFFDNSPLPHLETVIAP
jgi:hypothetical protein